MCDFFIKTKTAWLFVERHNGGVALDSINTRHVRMDMCFVIYCVHTLEPHCNNSISSVNKIHHFIAHAQMHVNGAIERDRERKSGFRQTAWGTWANPISFGTFPYYGIGNKSCRKFKGIHARLYPFCAFPCHCFPGTFSNDASFCLIKTIHKHTSI